jgi:hypothetical protein
MPLEPVEHIGVDAETHVLFGQRTTHLAVAPLDILIGVVLRQPVDVRLRHRLARREQPMIVSAILNSGN